MGVDALRILATSVAFAALGTPITVTRPSPDEAPIATTGIWSAPLDEGRPVGTDFQRVNARRVMAVPVTADLPSLPRGTTILAAPDGGTEIVTWRVDGYERPLEADEMRVILIRIADFP